MPKYRIDTSVPANKVMRATATLRWGDEIVAERPLFEREVGLQHTYDSTSFFNPGGPFSGARHLDTTLDRLTASQRTALRNLHNPGGTLTSLVQANAFGETKERHGHNYVVLRIFEKISRANHSCRPNAVYSWNPDLANGGGKATLHAVTTINNGAEIVIDYMAAEANALRDGATRRADLQQTWAFLCTCSACVGNLQLSAANDDIERLAALPLCNSMNNSVLRPGESEEQSRARRVLAGVRYIGGLERLFIRDEKLADAYSAVAKLHLRGFELAELNGVNTHCTTCTTQGTSRRHLERALDAFTSAYQTCIRCMGANHFRVAEELENIEVVNRALVRVRTRGMDF